MNILEIFKFRNYRKNSNKNALNKYDSESAKTQKEMAYSKFLINNHISKFWFLFFFLLSFFFFPILMGCKNYLVIISLKKIISSGWSRICKLKKNWFEYSNSYLIDSNIRNINNLAQSEFYLTLSKFNGKIFKYYISPYLFHYKYCSMNKFIVRKNFI